MKKLTLTWLAICLSYVGTPAQSQTGNLLGTVSDASGVIQGATVVVKNNQTGTERTVTTGDSGGFSLSQVGVGTYTVTVTSPGHKTFTATDLKIDVGKDYTLTVTLDVGDISENITVVAGVDIINSVDAQLNNTVSQRQILELPLNGRNPLSLVLLQPGTSSNGQQNTTINGQRSSFTNITRDGINVQDNFIRANAVDFIPDRPNVDDTAEFTIITQNAGAELGFGSSQVQLVTPRGSNDFHGGVFIFNRASHFAANNYFNNFSGIRRPFLNRNQYGGKLGGPILKGRLFFFGAYEGFRLRQSTTVNRTILLPAARTGIFTYRDASGVTRSVNLFSLASGLSGSPPAGIDSLISTRILANLPADGNNATIGDQLNTTGLSFSRANNQNREAFTTRFDWEITDRQRLSGTYSYRKELLMRNDVEAQQGGVACCYSITPGGFQDAQTPFLALGWHWNVNENLTNEVRGGWQASYPAFGTNDPAPPFFMVVPLISNPETGFQAQGRDTRILNFQDNATWTHGSHLIRFGGQYQGFRIRPYGPGAFGAPYIPAYTIGGGSTPAFSTGNTGTFNTAAGCVPSTGVNCASAAQIGTANGLLGLLGGLFGTGTQTFTARSKTGSLADVPPERELAFENYSGYISDQWRVGPTLTLNLGLRYDLFSPVRETKGLILEPVLGGRDLTTALLDPNGTYDFVGVNNGGFNFFKSDKNNFGPIVSFAWSPAFKNKFMNRLFPGEGRTVLRGGYRRSFVNDEFVRAADNALLNNAGLTLAVNALGNFRSTSLPTFAAPPVVVPRTYVQNNANALNFGTVFAIDPDLQAPGTHEFNIGISRELGWQTALEVRYVHGRSSNLVRGLDLNQVRIFNGGFFEDFLRARNNLARGLNVNCSSGAGCQPLQVLNQPPFNTSIFGNPLLSSAILNPIAAGDVGQLAFVYLGTFRIGNNVLLNNPNTGVVDLLTNSAKFRHNSLQAEIRRRFSGGWTFQANYTFQKTLTDAPGTGQTRFEPLIDNALGADLEYAIADFDTTHVFNLNAIYELPFGKGKRFGGNAGQWLNRLIGDWQMTSIVRIDSGAPFSITEPRGTLNRVGRSGRQTANTSLTKDEVRALIGTFKTPCGIFYINPQVINIDLDQCQQGLIRPRVPGTTAGVASLGFDPLTGPKTFPGQVFFNVSPGETGNMERNFLHGPIFVNWDASIIKTIRITEQVRFQMRAEAFNVLNRPTFTVGNLNLANQQFASANINSPTFGRSFTTFPAARVVQFVGRLEF